MKNTFTFPVTHCQMCPFGNPVEVWCRHPFAKRDDASLTQHIEAYISSSELGHDKMLPVPCPLLDANVLIEAVTAM